MTKASKSSQANGLEEFLRPTSQLGRGEGLQAPVASGGEPGPSPGSTVGTVSRAETRPYTEVIKQNLSLICKCQQQYKRWSDDD